MAAPGWRGAGAKEGVDIVDAHRPLYVLQHLLAGILEGEVEPTADIVTHRARNSDAARLGDALDARGDIDSIAVNVVVLDNDVAEIDADAEFDAPVLGHIGIPLAHFPLDFGGAGDRVHHARKLDQHAVAGKFSDAALVLGNLAVDQFLAVCLQTRRACPLRWPP